ncbi:MAG: 5-formyltetrahydrofolate cyclo-ligase [Polyangiaceae bacterium]
MPDASRLPPDDVIRVRVKAELRKRLRGVRATMPADACAKRSERIVVRLASHPAVVAAKSVALFWPIVERHEVDLRPLDASLRARGIRVAYPWIDPETRAMTFRFSPAEELEERGFGFCEPAPTAPEASPGELDVVVVPAIAIDPTGHRIGYGAGFYDRTIVRFAPPAVTIGIAFDFQLVAEVPFTEHDVAVAYVVTDEREMAAGAGP